MTSKQIVDICKYHTHTASKLSRIYFPRLKISLKQNLTRRRQFVHLHCVSSYPNLVVVKIVKYVSITVDKLKRLNHEVSLASMYASNSNSSAAYSTNAYAPKCATLAE